MTLAIQAAILNGANQFRSDFYGQSAGSLDPQRGGLQGY